MSKYIEQTGKKEKRNGAELPGSAILVVGHGMPALHCPHHHGAPYARVHLPAWSWGTLCPRCPAYLAMGLPTPRSAARVVVGYYSRVVPPTSRWGTIRPHMAAHIVVGPFSSSRGPTPCRLSPPRRFGRPYLGMRVPLSSCGVEHRRRAVLMRR